MDSLESSTVTFVITIWVDRQRSAAGWEEVAWRGEIRDVMGETPRRVAFSTLAAIPAHIRPHLETRGVRFGFLSWLRGRIGSLIVPIH